MPDEPETSVRIDQFGGQVSNANPHDLPPGAAAVQVNLVCNVPGELSTRLGLREITFDVEG